MQDEKQKSSERNEQQPTAKIVNLDDYAGDVEDNQKAKEQANRYREDVNHSEKAKNNSSSPTIDE